MLEQERTLSISSSKCELRKSASTGVYTFEFMKKLLLKLIAFIMAVAIIIVPGSIMVDPYNVFHPYTPRDNGIESNKSFIKTEYIKKHHDEFDSLVFGSSRAGFVDIGYLSDVTGERFYDMASSESLVSEQTVELKELIKSGFIPKSVWVLVDDISCFVDPKLHENMLYRVPYPAGGIIDRTEFYLKYMDLITVCNSMQIINENSVKKAAEQASGIDNSYDNSTHMSYLDRFYHTGTERLDKASQFNPNEEQYQIGYWTDYYSYRGEDALEDVKELVSLCNEYDINLKILTNPLYYLTYQRGVEEGYLEFLEGLATITDYYNFSGYSEVTCDYTNYYETSHFTPEVTRMMIDCVVGSRKPKGSFGVYVTSDNIGEFISMLRDEKVD